MTVQPIREAREQEVFDVVKRYGSIVGLASWQVAERVQWATNGRSVIGYLLRLENAGRLQRIRDMGQRCWRAKGVVLGAAPAATSEDEMMRWQATVYYRTESGLVDVIHDFDEISDIEAAIEKGPSFLAIDHITVTYEGCAEKLTVEEAEEQ